MENLSINMAGINNDFVLIEHKSNCKTSCNTFRVFDDADVARAAMEDVGPKISELNKFTVFQFFLYKNTGKTLSLIREKTYNGGMCKDVEY